jgi:branched-chain amino acid transport system ATP-binding protein
MPLLEVSELNAFYGDLQALHEISFTVDEGEVIAIIGANGAGKTTLMRSIAGLIRSRAGRMTFGGADITGLRADRVARLGIASVPEGRCLYPSLTVEENLAMGTAAKRDGPWTLPAVYELFPILREFRRRPATALSGGQQQMVAIGRALMGNPRLLLCDELSLGLAPKIVGEIYACFDRIRQSGLAILLVEQDVTRALQVASTVHCFLKGRISLSGAGSALGIDAISHAYFGG